MSNRHSNKPDKNYDRIDYYSYGTEAVDRKEQNIKYTNPYTTIQNGKGARNKYISNTKTAPKNKYRNVYQDNVNDYYSSNAVEIPLELPKRDINKPLKRNSKHKKQSVSLDDVTFNSTLIICGLLMFISCMYFVNTTSSIQIKQQELKSIARQLRDTDSLINNVRAQIDAKYDVEKIESLAETHLNMRKPLPHQVVYLNIDDDSYTVYSGN